MAKFNNHEMAIIEVVVDGATEAYDLGNLQDIFGRCDGEQASFERIDQVFDEIWQKDEIVTFDELRGRMYAEGETRYYVIEYTDETNSTPNFGHVVISTRPERTNMSRVVRTEGWLGTTQGLCVYARGMYDSVEAARTFIKAHYEEGVREVDDFYTDGDTIIAKFLLGRYETLDSEATAEFVYDELMERIGADSTDDEIRAFADDMERAANSEINATLTRVEEMAITHRANLQSEA